MTPSRLEAFGRLGPRPDIAKARIWQHRARDGDLLTCHRTRPPITSALWERAATCTSGAATVAAGLKVPSICSHLDALGRWGIAVRLRRALSTRKSSNAPARAVSAPCKPPSVRRLQRANDRRHREPPDRRARGEQSGLRSPAACQHGQGRKGGDRH
jgi:hypothetical protein